MKISKLITGGVVITSMSTFAVASDVDSRGQVSTNAQIHNTAQLNEHNTVQSNASEISFNPSELTQSEGSLFNTVQELMSELFLTGGSNEPLC